MKTDIERLNDLTKRIINATNGEEPSEPLEVLINKANVLADKLGVPLMFGNSKSEPESDPDYYVSSESEPEPEPEPEYEDSFDYEYSGSEPEESSVPSKSPSFG